MGLLDQFSASVEAKGAPQIASRSKASATPPFSSMLFILSLVAANIASGYTTFYGLKETINQPIVAFLATIAIQGMMLGTALRIAQQKSREHLPALLLLYLAPMLVSIVFNYIFFHALFYQTATAKARPQNEAIRLRNVQSTLSNEAAAYLSSLRNNLESQIQKARAAAASTGLAKQEELTERGTGGRGPGLHYRGYRDAEQSAIQLEGSLEGIDSNISSLRRAFFSLVEKGDIVSLQKAYSSLLEIRSVGGMYTTTAFPLMPRMEKTSEGTLGENHSVFEALNALRHPTLFEIISLGLGILMDSVVFIWVIVRFASNVTLIEVVS